MQVLFEATDLRHCPSSAMVPHHMKALIAHVKQSANYDGGGTASTTAKICKMIREATAVSENDVFQEEECDRNDFLLLYCVTCLFFICELEETAINIVSNPLNQGFNILTGGRSKLAVMSIENVSPSSIECSMAPGIL
jgi:hypothetical protein